MENLTTEQINIAKGFSDTMKNDYNQLRTNGVPMQEAFSIVSAIPAKEVTPTTIPENILGGIKTMVSDVYNVWKEPRKVNENFKEDYLTGKTGLDAWKNITQSWTDFGNSLVNPEVKPDVSFGVNAGTALAGSGLKFVQAFFSPVSQVFEKAATMPGNIGSLASGINKLWGTAGVLSADLGEGAVEALPFVSQETKDAITPVVKEIGALAGQIALGYGTNKMEQKLTSYTKNVINTLSEASRIETLNADPAFKYGMQESLKADKAQQGAQPAKPKSLSEYIKFESPSKGIIEISKAPISAKVFEAATKRGFTPEDSRFYADLGNADKITMGKMLNLSEKLNAGELPATFNERPIDYLGNKVKTTINEAFGKMDTFGKQLDTIAENLKTKPINTEPLINSLNETLSKYGIDVVKDINGKVEGFDFSGSDFALLKNTELQTALNYAYSPKANAFDIHRIKKTLDTLISGSKASEGLAGQSKSLIQQLRKTVDNFLDTKFADYKAINDKLTDTFKVKEAVNDLFGKNTSIEAVGQKFRSIFSNNVNRGATNTFIETLGDYAAKYGIKTEGNIANIAKFAEKLEDLYGTQAITGLRGNIERAVKGAFKVADAVRNPVRGVLNLAGDAIEKIAGQTDADRMKFVKDLLGDVETPVEKLKTDVVNPKTKTEAKKKLNDTKKELIKNNGQR